MEPELKLKLELLQKELAKKKLKLQKLERRKNAKDHVRQKIKEQAELYALPGDDDSLGADAATNAVNVVGGPEDITSSISVNEPPLAENPRKCCVSFKLTPIHVSSLGDAVNEEFGRVKNSDLIQSDKSQSSLKQSDLIQSDPVISDLAKCETFVNSDLPLIADAVILDPVSCDLLMTSHSPVNASGKANPSICADVSFVCASLVNTSQHVNPDIEKNDSGKSNSTSKYKLENDAGFFPNGLEYSEEVFAPEDVTSRKKLLHFTETDSNGHSSEKWMGAESKYGMPSTDVMHGLNFSADENKEFAEEVDRMLNENERHQFNDLCVIYSALQCQKVTLDKNHDEPTDSANEEGNKLDEYAIHQMTSEPADDWISNGQEDGSRKLTTGATFSPLEGNLSCIEGKEMFWKDMSKREVDLDETDREDLLVSQVLHNDTDGTLQNRDSTGHFLDENIRKLDFQSNKISRKTGLDTQSNSENSELQKKPDSIIEINLQCSVEPMLSDSIAPNISVKSRQKLKNLPTSTSCLGSQNAGACATDLADCSVTEESINLNSFSFSASDLSFLDKDTDDLYSRVKAGRRRTAAKLSSVNHNAWSRTTDKSKHLTEFDGCELQYEAGVPKRSCKKFVSQRGNKHFKKDFENSSGRRSLKELQNISARQSSVDLEGSLTKQSSLTEGSETPLSSDVCETVSDYKNDDLPRFSKTLVSQNGSSYARKSLESNSTRQSTYSSENPMDLDGCARFATCNTDNLEGSSKNLVALRGRKRVRKDYESGSLKQCSLTDNSVVDSSTGLSRSAHKKIRRSGRLKDKLCKVSEQTGVHSSLPDMDAIRHVLAIVRHSLMDECQLSEEFSLPDVEYDGIGIVKCNSSFVSRSLLSSQIVENLSQSSVGNLLEADPAKLNVSTVDDANERDENRKILENKMQAVEEVRHDNDSISRNDFISPTTESSQVCADTCNKQTAANFKWHGFDSSQMVQKLSVEQPESATLTTDFIQLLDNSSCNVEIQDQLWLQSSFEGSTIRAGSWSLTGISKTPVIICYHGNGLTVYGKETDKSEWSLWSTWNADTDQSLISAWPLSICGLLLITKSVHETCIEIVFFDSAREQRCLTVTRLARGYSDQHVCVCVLAEHDFCIGTLYSDVSNEWEVTAYSVTAYSVTVMPGLTLEGRILHLLCIVGVPGESCVCGLSLSEVFIWHVATGSLLQKISLNLSISHCPFVFHENGLLFLLCLLSNSSASGCLVVLNPVTTKSCILLEYESSQNDLKQAYRFTSSGVGDEFFFAVTETGTLLIWSLFSGALVAKSSGVHVKSATLIGQNTLGVMICNRITTIQLLSSKSQLVDDEKLLLCH